MESCLQYRTHSVRCAAMRNFESSGRYRFSDDKDLLRKLFPEPHMSELVDHLTYALGEVERFLSMIEIK